MTKSTPLRSILKEQATADECAGDGDTTVSQPMGMGSVMGASYVEGDDSQSDTSAESEDRGKPGRSKSDRRRLSGAGRGGVHIFSSFIDIVTSQQFLQTVALVTLTVLVMNSNYVKDAIMDRLTILHTVPMSESLVPAFLSGVVVAVIRVGEFSGP